MNSPLQLQKASVTYLKVSVMHVMNFLQLAVSDAKPSGSP